MMKLLKHIFMACLVAVIAVSCTKEATDNQMEVGAVGITIDIPQISASRASEAGAGDENHIKELKLFFFDALTGALDMVIPIDPTQSENGNFSWDNTSRRLTIRGFEQLERERTVYAVINWTITQAELEAITTVAELQAALTTITAPIATPTKELPLVMSGKANNTFATKKAIAIKVNRQVVKFEITVTLDKRFTDAFPTYVFDQGTIELRNAPKSSFVCEQTAPALPSGNVMFSYAPEALPTTRSMTLYAYENPTSGVNDPQATYLILKMPYAATAGGAKTENNYYQLNIANQTDVANPTRTLRNTLYRMKVSVEGFGSDTPNPNAVQVTTTVLPWDAEDVTSSDGEFVKLEKEAIDLVCEAPQSFVIKVDDVSKTTVTGNGNAKNKYTMVKSTENGTITLNFTPDDLTTSVITPDYDIITIKHGKITKTVTVSYRPHAGFLMAKGDLTFKDHKFYLLPNNEAITPDAQAYYGACFKFGSILPIKNLDNGVAIDDTFDQNDVMWSPIYVGSYAGIQPETEEFVVHNLDRIKAGKGDPCRLVGLDLAAVMTGTAPIDNGIWRLPTENELKSLITTTANWSGLITSTNSRIYRKSDVFSLYFPLAGGRREDGVLGNDIVNVWGCWQSNTRQITALDAPYKGLITNKDTKPGALVLFNDGLPIQKAHTVRCIRQ